MNINKKNLKFIKTLSGFLVTILTVYLWSCAPASTSTGKVSMPALSSLTVVYYGKTLDLTPPFAEGIFEYTAGHVNYGSGTDNDAYVVTSEAATTLAAVASEADIKSGTGDNADTRIVTITVTETLAADVTRAAKVNEYVITITPTARPVVATLVSYVTTSVSGNGTVAVADTQPRFTQDSTDRAKYIASYAQPAAAASVTTEVALELTVNTADVGKVTIEGDNPVMATASAENTEITADTTIMVTVTESSAEYTSLPTAITLRSVVYELTIVAAGTVIGVNPELSALTIAYYGKALTLPNFNGATRFYTVADAQVDYGLADDSAGNDAYIATTTAVPTTATVSGAVAVDTVPDTTRTVTVTVTDSGGRSTSYVITITLTSRRSIAAIDAATTKTVRVNSAVTGGAFAAPDATPTAFEAAFVGTVGDVISFIISGDSTVTISPATSQELTAIKGDQLILTTVREVLPAEYTLLPTTVTGVVLRYAVRFLGL